MAKTDVVCTCGKQALVDPMGAEIAFDGDTPGAVKRNGIVGTGVSTRAAPCAPLLIKYDDAVFPLGNHGVRACLGARRRFTMAAYTHLKEE